MGFEDYMIYKLHPNKIATEKRSITNEIIKYNLKASDGKIRTKDDYRSDINGLLNNIDIPVANLLNLGLSRQGAADILAL